MSTILLDANDLFEGCSEIYWNLYWNILQVMGDHLFCVMKMYVWNCCA